MKTPLDLQAFPEGESRICPLPTHWNALWNLLGKYGEEEAPRPLILAGWNLSTDTEKLRRFTEQIRWAARFGRLDAAAEFLGALKSEDWHVANSNPPLEVLTTAGSVSTDVACFDTQRQELGFNGVFVIEGADPSDKRKTGFVACQANGDVFAFARNEDEAWAKAWASLRGDA